MYKKLNSICYNIEYSQAINELYMEHTIFEWLAYNNTLVYQLIIMVLVFYGLEFHVMQDAVWVCMSFWKLVMFGMHCA